LVNALILGAITLNLDDDDADQHDHPIGRLHTDVQPALRATDNRPMYVMNLTARGMYGTGFDFFDVGRQWIVRSFEQITTVCLR
jgi:hypothetical protein